MAKTSGEHPDLFGGVSQVSSGKKRMKVAVTVAAQPKVLLVEPAPVLSDFNSASRPATLFSRWSNWGKFFGQFTVIIAFFGGTLAYIPKPVVEGVSKFVSEHVTLGLEVLYKRSLDLPVSDRPVTAQPAPPLAIGSTNLSAQTAPRVEPLETGSVNSPALATPPVAPPDTGSIERPARTTPRIEPPASLQKPKPRSNAPYARKPSADPPEDAGPIVQIGRWLNGILNAVVGKN